MFKKYTVPLILHTLCLYKLPIDRACKDEHLGLFLGKNMSRVVLLLHWCLADCIDVCFWICCVLQGRCSKGLDIVLYLFFCLYVIRDTEMGFWLKSTKLYFTCFWVFSRFCMYLLCCYLVSMVLVSAGAQVVGSDGSVDEEVWRTGERACSSWAVA